MSAHSRGKPRAGDARGGKPSGRRRRPPFRDAHGDGEVSQGASARVTRAVVFVERRRVDARDATAVEAMTTPGERSIDGAIERDGGEVDGVDARRGRCGATREGRCLESFATTDVGVFPSQPGKVVVVLAGRYAGKKAVIVKNVDDGNSAHPYGHALVCGLSTIPRKVRNDLHRCARTARRARRRDRRGERLVARRCGFKALKP